MGWRDSLRAGTFRGVPFKVESADGEIGRRVALHEYPGRDKPYAEDLGRKARRFTVEMFVVGADYMLGRDALIAAIELEGAGELVHPWLGTMSVTVIEARGPRESTREGGLARFSVTFVEAGEAVFPASAPATASAVAAKADLAAIEAQRSFARAYSIEGRPAWLADHAQSLTAKLAGQLDALRRTMPTVPSAVTAFVADLQRVSASLESLVRAPADLAVEVYGLIADLALLPDRPLRAYSAYRQLWDAFSGESAIAATTANRRQQAQNQAALAALTRQAAVIEAARAAGGVDFASYDEAAALREELADALDAQMTAAADDEAYAALADLRVAVVRDLTARGASLARLHRVTPPATLPALVLAHRLYGDAAREAELVARNRLRHPGFVPGGQSLEVLSDV